MITDGEPTRWDVAVIPCDTVYGIVARLSDKEAVKRVYDIKNRDQSKGCIVLLSSIEELEEWPLRIPQHHYDFVKESWPGPASFIFPMNELFNQYLEYIYRGAEAPAFRVPSDPWLRDFVKEHGPLIAPSANPEGLPPATNCEMAKEYFGDQVDMYIDRGIRNEKPSRLIDLRGEEIIILRD